MKRIPWGMVTPLLIVVACTIALLVFIDRAQSGGTFAEAPVYISSGNIYHDVFTEPYETVIVLLEGGDYHAFTTQEAFSIAIGATYIREFLRLQGRKVNEVASIIHNHYVSPSFSEADKREYQRLLRYGFCGRFLLYHTPTGRIKKLNEDGRGEWLGTLEEGEFPGGFTLDKFGDNGKEGEK